jgi:plasmid stability protein
MPKTVQIRNIDDDVYAALKRRAAEAGLSVPNLLKREAERLASRPSMKEWLNRVSRRPINDKITREHILEALDELRGPWPDGEH